MTPQGGGRANEVTRRLRWARRKLTAERPWEKVTSRIRGQLHVDLGDPSRAVFLAGSARSGTTWISQVLNHDDRYRYVFEPFHPTRVRATRGLATRPYLHPEDHDPRYLRVVRGVLAGRVRSVYTDKYNRRLIARERLIKDVRANLLLAWIRRHFPQVPVVLIMRHPLAVMNSQMALRWNWHVDVPGLVAQRRLMADHLEPFRDLLTAPHDWFESHVLTWCVENHVPLRQFTPGQIHLAFYEDFCLDPEDAFRRLFDFVGRPFGPGALAAVGRPSPVSRSPGPAVSGRSRVESMRGSLSDEQVERTLELVRRFGLDRIYGDDPAPRPADPSEAFHRAEAR